MTDVVDEPKLRKGAATKAAILNAARERFCRDGYDNASLRDIAASAGVDAALISRYFGSKDDLFTEVLGCTGDPELIIDGCVESFPARIARELVYDAQDEEKLEGMMIMIRSISSPKASEIIRSSARERFFGPFTEWLGGPDAYLRILLLSSLMMGATLNKSLLGGFDLSETEKKVMCQRLELLITQCMAATKPVA